MAEECRQYKASELIAKLQELIAEHGDLPVCVPYFHSDYAVTPDLFIRATADGRGMIINPYTFEREAQAPEPYIEIAVKPSGFSPGI